MTNPTGLNIVKWNILLFIWADDVLYSKDLQPPTFFSFFFFFFCKFALFVSMQSLYAVSPLTQALHYNPENKTVSPIFSSEN